MKVLSLLDSQVISGGEIIPGPVSPDMMCLNTKLMLGAGRGVPGFDVTAAVGALQRNCADFWDVNVAHEYVVTGGIPVPPAA